VRRLVSLLVLLLVASAGGLAARTAPAEARPTLSAATRVVTFEQQLVAEINRVRSARGLRPLRYSHELTVASRRHSIQMGRRGFFAHESADGTPFWKRVRETYRWRGYARWSVGENLAWVHDGLTAETTVATWLRSPAHRRNVLSPAWRELGVAAIRFERAAGVYGAQPAVIVTTDYGSRG
jgi:uncharacterized protein YkwD